ncbi:hypothetical protein QTP70_004858 [Hemibagrus guttatus]|uniref:Endonuclease/exonuclease/phosphatase domain-containing protein n=1 Tax=Hemibagrus guttatus TaxID=175788 RepID=A0AAE0R8S2_9TELE|nr:hypothetical protein QTP70_004858 [Hemibagrus guttatus]KAK3569874.1 hypothetical protein QTP86_006754 [Hemibagrus guttatus]
MEKYYQMALGTVWRLRRGKQFSANTVYSGGGALLTLTGDIVRQWKEYCKDLLNPTDMPSIEEAEAEDSEVDSSVTQAEVTGGGIRPCPMWHSVGGALGVGVHGPPLRAVQSLQDWSKSLVRIVGCPTACMGQFAAEYEAAGMRISTSKSEAMVLDWKKVACPFQVGGEFLPQVEEFKYLWVLFTSEGRMDHEIDRWIGAAAAVMQSMYRSVVVKKELNRKIRLDAHKPQLLPLRNKYQQSHREKERDGCWLQEKTDHSPLNINGSNVEIVKSTKFLSVHLAEDLTWSLNTSSITKTAQQRHYFLRRLRKAHLLGTIESIESIESILSSCITAWFGNCTISDWKTLQRIVRTVEKIIGVSLPSITDMYTVHCIRKARSIVDDPTHPSHTLFNLLPSGKRRRHSHPRSRGHVSSNLIYPPLLSQSQTVVVGGLWNCQFAVRKADFISALASHYTFDFLALTETWISPQNTATPAALSSAYTFSHSPRESGRGGGTVSVTSPINLFIIVIYRPPGPLVLGDFNLPSDKLLALLDSFSLSFNSSPPTYKEGNVLDLVFTHPSPATDMTVTPLHISDHHLVSFTITLHVLPKRNSQHLSLTRRNLHSISPSSVASCTLSSLPDHESFSSLPLNSATDTLLSSPSSTMDLLCPLSTIRKKNSSTAPWLSDVLHNNRRELRSAARKWKKSKLDTDLISYHTLLSKFSLDLTSAKTSFYKEKLETSAQDPQKLHNIFSSLLNPLAPPSPSSLTAEDFATFYTAKIERICQTFTSLPTSPTSHSQHSATPSLTQFSTVA